MSTMPFYRVHHYVCKTCDIHIETDQTLSDKGLKCKACGGTMIDKLSPRAKKGNTENVE